MNRKITRVRGKKFVTLELEISPDRVSICGVSGHVGGSGRSGDRVGTYNGHPLFGESFGQIPADILEFFPEMAPYMRWHLNDMRPGCEHQTAEGWGENPIQVEIVTYKLTSEALQESGAIQREAKDRLAKGETVTLTEEQRAIVNLPYHLKHAPSSEGVESGRYEVERREMKSIGWLRPDEHSAGILCKPCPVCGYKYGTEWKKEAIPANVLTFLENLK